MKPKSESLFHFTSSIQFLEKILKDKAFSPRFCMEDLTWRGPNFDGSSSDLAFPMKCFCDIPLSRISDHTKFYGSYGLGMSKQWGEASDLEPVMYIRGDGKVSKMAEYMMSLYRGIDQEFRLNMKEHCAVMLRFIKPLKGKMDVNGKMVDKDFYQENEWRYVPPYDSYLRRDKFELNKEIENQRAADYPLKFTPTDIRYIFVKQDSDIPGLVDFIIDNTKDCSPDDVKIMITKIISLDTIYCDM